MPSRSTNRRGSVPSIRMVPAVGRSNPSTMESSVLFPAPPGPEIPAISPDPTRSDTSSITRADGPSLGA